MEPVWEQQPGEPNLWFGRFCRYKNLGYTRSFVATLNGEEAEKGTGKLSPSLPGAWNNAIAKWRWMERAAAWDIEQVRQAQHNADQRSQQRQFDAEDVIRQWVAIATADPTEFFDFFEVQRNVSDGATDYEQAIAEIPKVIFTLKKLDELPPEKRMAIAELAIEYGKYGQRQRIKFHSKTQALQSLAQYLGMLTDSNVAFETLKRFGYQIEKTEYGFKGIDTYTEAGKREAGLAGEELAGESG